MDGSSAGVLAFALALELASTDLTVIMSVDLMVETSLGLVASMLLTRRRGIPCFASCGLYMSVSAHLRAITIRKEIVLS